MSNERDGIFAVMWGCHGLEAVQKVPNPADITFALLKGAEPPTLPALMHWQLRARYNSQRHYEIYTFDSELTEEDINETFESDPQVMVDAIRSCGHEIYSDRVLKKTQVIV